MHCPLYLAAHVEGGCDDGRLDEGGCAVDRGASFDALMAEISVERYARMMGFVTRSTIDAGNVALTRIWPWLFQH